jgi:hypothetical protein
MPEVRILPPILKKERAQRIQLPHDGQPIKAFAETTI